MIYLNIKDKWQIILFFGNNQFSLLRKNLENIHCSNSEIKTAYKLINGINEGFTYSNLKLKSSVVGISKASNKGEWYSTLIHELKHVQSHICEYYNISESGEEAAYLIGYMVKKIYQMF